MHHRSASTFRMQRDTEPSRGRRPCCGRLQLTPFSTLKPVPRAHGKLPSVGDGAVIVSSAPNANGERGRVRGGSNSRQSTVPFRAYSGRHHTVCHWHGNIWPKTKPSSGSQGPMRSRFQQTPIHPPARGRSRRTERGNRHGYPCVVLPPHIGLPYLACLLEILDVRTSAMLASRPL